MRKRYITGNILTRHATRQKSSPDFCPYHDTKTEGCQDENINSPNLQNYIAFLLAFRNNFLRKMAKFSYRGFLFYPG